MCCQFYDVLLISCLASSTDVERAFSRGGLTVSKMCHSLSDESTCVASVVGSWCELPGAIDQSKIIESFKEKRRRPKGMTTGEVIEIADSPASVGVVVE